MNANFANFTFTSNQAGSTFQCRLDAAPYVHPLRLAADAQRTAEGLGPSGVFAVDPAGERRPDPGPEDLDRGHDLLPPPRSPRARRLRRPPTRRSRTQRRRLSRCPQTSPRSRSSARSTRRRRRPSRPSRRATPLTRPPPSPTACTEPAGEGQDAGETFAGRDQVVHGGRDAAGGSNSMPYRRRSATPPTPPSSSRSRATQLAPTRTSASSTSRPTSRRARLPRPTRACRTASATSRSRRPIRRATPARPWNATQLRFRCVRPIAGGSTQGFLRRRSAHGPVP